MTRLHPSAPIADGILFDDTHGLPEQHVAMLRGRGLLFATVFEDGDRQICGVIIAHSWPAAQDIAFGRGLGERVVGVLV